MSGEAETLTLAEDVLRRLQPAPFWDHLRCELIEAAPGMALVRFPYGDEYGRSTNTGDRSAHGGAVASLIDMASSCALMTLLGSEESRTTIDLAAHYLAPARGDLLARATVRRRGGRTAVIDTEVTAEDGTLAALGRATFAIVRRG
jgi:uncharacterized protein (TIGR00369 family)